PADIRVRVRVRRVHRKGPADADTHANVGWILLKVGREAEGLRELQSAVRLDPNLERERSYLDARFGREARQGPTPFSLRWRAADSAPTSVRALTARASMAEFLGEFNEARTFYDRAVALAPDDPGVIYHTASFAVRVGEYDRALGLLDRLLALHPRHVRWLFQWAPRVAQAWLLRENPSLEHIVQIKIDILTEKGDLEQARTLARAYAIVKADQNYCGEAQA